MQVRSRWTAACLVAMSVVFVGCGSQGSSPSRPAAGSPASSSSAPAAQSLHPDAALAKVIAQANKEGRLDVSWSTTTLGGDQGAHEVVAALNRYFGTHLQVKFTPGPSMTTQMQRIATEAAAHQPADSDVVLAAAIALSTVYNQHVLRPIDWHALLPGRITPQVVDSGVALQIATGLSGITYNTKLIPASEAPKTMADLLKPQFKGKIATTPYAAGFDYLGASGMWGKAKTLAYARKFSQQVGGLIRCGSEEQVAAGQFEIFALGCTGTTATVLARKGAPLKMIVPSDAAQFRNFEMAVPVNSAHPAAGTLFALFMDTPQGQALAWKTWGTDLAAFPGSHMAQEIAPLRKKGIKFFAPSIAWLAQHPNIEQTARQVGAILSHKGAKP